MAFRYEDASREVDLIINAYGNVKEITMEKLKDRYSRFQDWKLQPHQVAPLSEQQHECATCGTHYEGNYCPRCGQSAKIGRYSFKNAFLLYLDVWGLGNRGMFRSIRDLLLRPGYMIRDYLRGMQMAYFPPFKMFFLLTALSLLVNTGFNIQGINRMEQQKKATTERVEDAKAEAPSVKVPQPLGKALTNEQKKELAKIESDRIMDRSFEWADKHISEVTLFFLLLFSCPLWLLIRRCPAISDIRLSECFVAMVYICNMLYIYNIIPSLLCFSDKVENIYNLLSLLLIIIPIKQLSGYNYWSTTWRVVLAAMTLIVIVLSLYIAGIMIYISNYIIT